MSLEVYNPIWSDPYRRAFDPGNTAVYIIPASQILIPSPRVTILFGNNGANWRMGEVWIGHPGEGTPYDFDGNQAQVTFDGNPGITITDLDVLSDDITFQVDSTKNINIAAYIETFTGLPRSTFTMENQKLYYKSGNDASTSAKTGYAEVSWSGATVMVAKILALQTYKLSGTVKEKGNPVARTVRSYVRSTGALYSVGSSNSAGDFSLSAPNDTDEMFVVVFDDELGDQYNALIYDRVKPILV